MWIISATTSTAYCTRWDGNSAHPTYGVQWMRPESKPTKAVIRGRFDHIPRNWPGMMMRANDQPTKESGAFCDNEPRDWLYVSSMQSDVDGEIMDYFSLT